MISSRAPLRIPLGGGGTDLPSYYSQHGGFILSAAINRYVYIHINTLKVEDFLRVKYALTERVDAAAALEHPLLRESLLHTGNGPGLEISAMADFPGRTGMGSSGSFAVALLAALHALNGQEITPAALAEEAHYIEAVRAGQPAGKHDHYLAAFGGLTCLEIATNGQVEVSPLQVAAATLEELNQNMLLFFTGIQRESFDILDQQRQDTEAGKAAIIDNLHQVKAIGRQIKKSLENGDLDAFGANLDEHWRLKKKRSAKMSNSQIDNCYQQAKEAGALGGKILGAGGGGFLMFYCPPARQTAVHQALTACGLRQAPYQFDLEGAKVLMKLED